MSLCSTGTGLRFLSGNDPEPVAVAAARLNRAVESVVYGGYGMFDDDDVVEGDEMLFVATAG